MNEQQFDIKGRERNHPEPVEVLFREKDRAFYEEMLKYAEDNGITVNQSDCDIFSIGTQLSLSEIERISGYSQTNFIKAFLVGFYRWVWVYCEERDFAVRRIWYLRFKQFCIILFAKDYAEKIKNGLLSDKKKFGRYYSQKLSEILSLMVKQNADYSGLLYADFAISDLSRFTWTKPEYAWSNIFLFGEKDATTPLFEPLCEIIGIRKLYSGKGKSAKAAIEKLFLSGELNPKKPLICLTATDWDWDGINGVESGFVKQVQFYSRIFGFDAQFFRVGISPEDIPDNEKTPEGKCFVMERQHLKWVKENGIKYVNPEGKIEYLGIELEALPIRYWRNKILKILAEDVFDFEDWSNWSRKTHTPDSYDYEEARDQVARNLADVARDTLDLNAKILVLENELEKAKNEKDETITRFNEYMEEEAESLISLENWDDRQREWDELEEIWNPDSVEEMVSKHKKTVEISVDIEKQFVNYFNCLDFSKDQLIDKLREYLREFMDEQYSDEYYSAGEDREKIEYEIDFRRVEE